MEVFFYSNFPIRNHKIGPLYTVTLITAAAVLAPLFVTSLNYCYVVYLLEIDMSYNLVLGYIQMCICSLPRSKSKYKARM